MIVVATGGSGTVGSYLPETVIKPTHGEYSITLGNNPGCRPDSPTTLIHLAAATDVDRCEKYPKWAYQTNVVGVLNAIRHYMPSRIIYVSTAHPETTVYGRTKRIAEQLVKDICPNHLIIRTGWIFGGGVSKDKKFVGSILEQLKDGQKITAINDVYGHPTYAKDLAEFIMDNIANPELHAGTIGFCNLGIASRYDIAYAITCGAVGVPSISFPTTPPRANEILSNPVTGRAWQIALSEYILTEWTENDKLEGGGQWRKPTLIG